MLRVIILLSLAAVCGAAEPLTDDRILESVRDRASVLAEVTTAPVLMQGRVSQLCRPATAQEIADEKANPHLEKFSRFYAAKAGLAAAQGHESVHPEGTLLIKEKLPVILDKSVDKDGKLAAGSKPELFTGMLKREKGFNPACGDWEFFTVSGDAGKITSRGKLANCMDCHQRFADRDFTSRKLVPARGLLAKANGTISLPASEAMVYGTGVRYDRTKDVLTSWAGKGDAAAWDGAVAKGRYAVEVMVACSAENAGAEVELQWSYDVEGRPVKRISCKVKDTGGAGNFKSFSAGTFEFTDDAKPVIKVTPESKPGVPPVEIKRIMMWREGDPKAGR